MCSRPPRVPFGVSHTCPLRYNGSGNAPLAREAPYAKEVCLDAAEIARIVAEVADDKKATDIVTLDIRERSVIADYFVICTGSNPRQIGAVANAVEDKLSELHVPMRGFEGSADTGWMLLDCGDVIVHIFGPMEREFYRLDRFWSTPHVEAEAQETV